MGQVSYGTITITDTNDIERIYPVFCKGGANNAPALEPLSNWKEDISAIVGTGDYIWQRIVTKKSGINVTSSDYSDAVRLTGDTGSSAAPLTITQTEYAQTQNENDTPSYRNSMPSPSNEGYWLWVKITYSDGSSVVTKIKQGKEGEDAPLVNLIADTATIVTNSTGTKVPSRPFYINAIYGNLPEGAVKKWYYALDGGNFQESLTERTTTYAFTNTNTKPDSAAYAPTYTLQPTDNGWLWLHVIIVYQLTNSVDTIEYDSLIQVINGELTNENEINEYAYSNSKNQPDSWIDEETYQQTVSDNTYLWVKTTFTNTDKVCYSYSRTDINFVNGATRNGDVVTINPISITFKTLSLKASVLLNNEVIAQDSVTISQTNDAIGLATREIEYLLTDNDTVFKDFNFKHQLKTINLQDFESSINNENHTITISYTSDDFCSIPLEKLDFDCTCTSKIQKIVVGIDNSKYTLSLGTTNLEITSATFNFITREIITNELIDGNIVEQRYNFECELPTIRGKFLGVFDSALDTSEKAKGDYYILNDNIYYFNGTQWVTSAPQYELTIQIEGTDTIPIFNNLTLSYWDIEPSYWIADDELNANNLFIDKYNLYMFRRTIDTYTNGTVEIYGPELYQVYQTDSVIDRIESLEQQKQNPLIGSDQNGNTYIITPMSPLEDSTQDTSQPNPRITPIIDFNNIKDNFVYKQSSSEIGFNWKDLPAATFSSDNITFYAFKQDAQNNYWNMPGLRITNQNITFYDTSKKERILGESKGRTTTLVTLNGTESPTINGEVVDISTLKINDSVVCNVVGNFLGTSTTTITNGGTEKPTINEEEKELEGLLFQDYVTYNNINYYWRGNQWSINQEFTAYWNGTNWILQEYEMPDTPQLILGNGAKIQSGNYIADSDYSAAGTLINLDDGSITTPNFYLKSGGEVGIRGHIEAKSGSIGGFSIGDNILTSDDIYITSSKASNYFIKTGEFGMTHEGEIYAKDVNITGTLTINFDEADIPIITLFKELEKNINANTTDLSELNTNVESIETDLKTANDNIGQKADSSKVDEQLSSITDTLDTIETINKSTDTRLNAQEEQLGVAKSDIDDLKTIKSIIEMDEEEGHPYIQLSTVELVQNNEKKVRSALKLRDDYITFIVQDVESNTHISSDRLITENIDVDYLNVGNFITEERTISGYNHYSVIYLG